MYSELYLHCIHQTVNIHYIWEEAINLNIYLNSVPAQFNLTV